MYAKPVRVGWPRPRSVDQPSDVRQDLADIAAERGGHFGELGGRQPIPVRVPDLKLEARKPARPVVVQLVEGDVGTTARGRHGEVRKPSPARS